MGGEREKKDYYRDFAREVKDSGVIINSFKK